jgi:arabinan endo-1,5-alpha-L-arabinosidase
LITPGSMGLAECTKPFFYAFGSRAFVFFQGGDGMYGQELTLNKTAIAELKGDKFRVTGPAIESMNLLQLNGYYYLFGAVEDGNASRITIARSQEITGPYLDQEGNGLMNGEGTVILQGDAGNGFVAVNHIGGVFEDANNNLWLIHQATDVDLPALSSGAPRHPLVLTRVELDENGWPAQVFEARKGWNYPKFAK